jgi:dihydrofolate synthase/folylpolyglutamate synthase
MADKDIDSLLKHVVPLVDFWHCCDLPSGRAAKAADLVQTVALAAAGRTGGPPEVQAHDGPTAALRAAAAAADPADRIVVFGSFLTVGGVLKDGLPRFAAPHVAAAAPALTVLPR